MARFHALIADHNPWGESEHLRALIHSLNDLTADGLTPADYHVEALNHALGHLETWGNLPDCDKRLATAAYLQALSDLRYGRAFNRKQPDIWYSSGVRDPIDPEKLVALAINSLNDPVRAMASARPDSRRYRNLRKGYIKASHSLPRIWPRIPAGPLLQEGDSGERVVLVRDRLQAENYIPLPPRPLLMSMHFDAELTLAVKRFQHEHTLKPDGKVGPDTLRQLNISPQTRLEQIRANLERLRWLDRDMEDSLLLVDIAGARVEFYEHGEIIWSGRAQVGKPKRATPELKSVITHVTVNPHWNMPRSIFLKDALPAIQRDPDYLNNRHIRVYDRSGQELLQSDIDWGQTRDLRLRQDPGRHNALGQVVIRFSNPFAVYLHDTPARGLFRTSSRFYSSGCVRVEGAMALTELLFRNASAPLQREFEQARASGLSHNVHLPRGVYILMAYWTAEADETGQITYRPDVYGSDATLLAVLER